MNKRFTKSCLFLVIETCIVVKIPFPMFHIYGSSKQVNEKVIRDIPPKNPIYFHEKEPYLHLIIPPHEKQFVNECHFFLEKSKSSHVFKARNYVSVS